jgi:hypothetical protein
VSENATTLWSCGARRATADAASAAAASRWPPTDPLRSTSRHSATDGRPPLGAAQLVQVRGAAPRRRAQQGLEAGVDVELAAGGEGGAPQPPDAALARRARAAQADRDAPGERTGQAPQPLVGRARHVGEQRQHRVGVRGQRLLEGGLVQRADLRRERGERRRAGQVPAGRRAGPRPLDLGLRRVPLLHPVVRVVA